MRIRLLAIFTLALLCVRAQPESTPKWLQVTTPHFTVITDAGEKQARQVAGQFERMQTVFHKILPGAKSDPGSPIVVIAVKNRRDFQALLPSAYLSKGSLELAGFFMQSNDRNYILVRLDTEGVHPYSTVYHEYTHYITRHDNLPLWLGEGMAEFFENTDIDSKEVRFGQPNAADLQILRSQPLLPLPTLFTVDHDSPYYHNEQKGTVFYSESWALTYMLYNNDFSRKTTLISNYLRALDSGQTSLTAAVTAFGDLKKLQSALNNELGASSLQYFALPLVIANDEASYKVTPLTLADANAYRADVLVCNNRIDDAQKLIDSVLASNPNSALAYESEGLLHLRQSDVEGARKAYAQSAALHSTSFLAWYYAGVLNMRHSIAENPEIETDLQQSLKLNPNFAPANDALAGYYTATRKNLDDALRLSLMAVTAEPDNLRYRLNNANLHMVRNESDSALAVLEAARPLAHSAGEIAELNARINEIHRFEDRAAAANSASTSATVTTVADVKTVTIVPGDEDPHFPDSPPIGPHRTARGVLHNVKCAYPTILTLTVEGGPKPVALYTNHMYKIEYWAGNFYPKGGLDPCKIDGMKGVVTYTQVTDPRVAGQIVAIEVRK